MTKECNPKVTSITLTFNEEDHIGDCLESISWCDEHIVIDEYSNDATVEIAESHGADVYQMRTPEDANTYEILRKEAMDRASHNWILRIDADERSHEELNLKLQNLAGVSEFDLIQVPRMTYINGKWIKNGRGWWPDRSPVLFHKDSMEIIDRVHRSMTPVDDAETIQLPAEPESALHHYSYDSRFDLLKRYWRWSKSEAEVYDLPFCALLFLVFSDLVDGIIVERGLLKGIDGIIIPVIDSLYHIFLLYHRTSNKLD